MSKNITSLVDRSYSQFFAEVANLLEQAKKYSARSVNAIFALESRTTLLQKTQQSGGDYRVLRKGTNEWTCLPGVPGYSDVRAPDHGAFLRTCPL